MFAISGTVRRFLEKFGDDIDLIVFVVTGSDRVYLYLFYYIIPSFFLLLVIVVSFVFLTYCMQHFAISMLDIWMLSVK